LSHCAFLRVIVADRGRAIAFSKNAMQKRHASWRELD
jgi:hypothetical protein